MFEALPTQFLATPAALPVLQSETEERQETGDERDGAVVCAKVDHGRSRAGRSSSRRSSARSARRGRGARGRSDGAAGRSLGLRSDILAAADDRLADGLARGVVGVGGRALADGVLALERRKSLRKVGDVEVRDGRVAGAVVREGFLLEKRSIRVRHSRRFNYAQCRRCCWPCCHRKEWGKTAAGRGTRCFWSKSRPKKLQPWTRPGK